MKTLLFALLFSLPISAQSISQTFQLGQSNGVVTYQNSIKGTSLTVVENAAGNPISPSSFTFTIWGCFFATGCETPPLDTYTGPPASTRNPAVSKVYDYFKVQGSWLGGTQVTGVLTMTIGAGSASPGQSGSGTVLKNWSCQTGLGDGTNAIASGTYLQSFCYNDTGSTVTLTGVRCYADAGTVSLNATNGSSTALLTGAVTCSPAFAPGTQSNTTTLASGDFVEFTFVADGTAKQTTWVVTGSY